MERAWTDLVEDPLGDCSQLLRSEPLPVRQQVRQRDPLGAVSAHMKPVALPPLPLQPPQLVPAVWPPL